MQPPASVRIGCAGWNIRRDRIDRFPPGPTILHRYAGCYSTVEINSSFYRPHRRSTYQRWADSVGKEFLFTVKIPKFLTHEQRLHLDPDFTKRFLDEVAGLGSKLGVLLVQLPPSLVFQEQTASNFFDHLRQQTSTPIVCEPRHATWFTDEADALLRSRDVSRIVADPLCDSRGAVPGGAAREIYVRLHGSPRLYYSAYDEAQLRNWAEFLQGYASAGRRAWCIFDNTAAGEAVLNSLSLIEMLADGSS